MKIVYCTNCGTKYQLNDEDNINEYECTVCTGSLTHLHKENEDITEPPLIEKIPENIVYCIKCQLRYQLDPNEDIKQYKCTKCDGNLRYLNEEKNKQELQKEIQKETKTPTTTTPVADIDLLTIDKIDKINEENIAPKIQIETQEPDISLKEAFDKNRQTLKPEDKFDETPDLIIPIATDIEKTPITLTHEKIVGGTKTKTPPLQENKTIPELLNEISNKVPEDMNIAKTCEEYRDKRKSYFEFKKSPYTYFIALEILFIILGAIDFILSQRLFSIIFSVVFIIITIITLVKHINWNNNINLEKILIKNLSTLPLNYFILSEVRTPTMSSQINHIVIGPTGIFTILTQNYKDKELDKNQESFENQEPNLNTEDILKDYYIQGLEDKTEDKDKKSKLEFENNSKIKRKSIELSEELLEYLENCNITNLDVYPLVAFVNKKIAVINNPLSDKNLFLDELLIYITNQEEIIDNSTSLRSTVILSNFSTKFTL